MRKATFAVAVAASVIPASFLAAPAQAQDGTKKSDLGYITVSGVDPVRDVVVLSTSQMIPGDFSSGTIKVKNTAPNSGILKAYIVDRNVTNDLKNFQKGSAWESFQDQIRAEWQGELGSGGSNFRALQKKHAIGETSLMAGETTDLRIAVNYPKSATGATERTTAEYPTAQFAVRFEMAEAYPSAELSLQVVPHLPAGVSVATLGTLIQWEFKVTNSSEFEFTDIKIMEDYLSSLGQTVKCGADRLASKQTVSCWAFTTVSQADVDRGSIQMKAQVSGALPDTSVKLSQPVNVTVPIQAPVKPTTPPTNPTGSPTPTPTTSPTPTQSPTSTPRPTDTTPKPTPTITLNPNKPVDKNDGNNANVDPIIGTDDSGKTGTGTTGTKGTKNGVTGALIKSGEIMAKNPWQSAILGSLMITAAIVLLAKLRRRKN